MERSFSEMAWRGNSVQGPALSSSAGGPLCVPGKQINRRLLAFEHVLVQGLGADRFLEPQNTSVELAAST